jgi:hypothetical protein
MSFPPLTQTAPDGFEIDPATGMPRRGRSAKTSVSPLASPTDPLAGLVTQGKRGQDPGDPTGVTLPPPTLTPPPTGTVTAGTSTLGTTTNNLKNAPPSFVNINDPVQEAVWAAFAQKNISPRDQGDFQYWVDKINQTGGWANPSNKSFWLSRMAQPQGGVGDYSGAPETGSTTVTSSSTLPTAPGSVTGPQMDPWLHDQIAKLLSDNQQPVDPNDPIIKAQTDAARVAGTRELTTARNAAAERAAAEGLPTAAFDNAVVGNQEKLGENLSSMTAGLMANELQNRRAQVVNALSSAQGQDAQALNLQLAQIDAALKQQQLGQQNTQFYDSLSSNLGMDAASLNQIIQRLLLGGA